MVECRRRSLAKLKAVKRGRIITEPPRHPAITIDNLLSRAAV